jgi:aryl-phospho-beta-D-glucosidase BglC (GH1 family)
MRVPWYGFNLQWLFITDEPPTEPDERVLDAIAGWGFNFIRLPCDYRFFTQAPVYPSADQDALARVDRCIGACRQRGLHLSLNLHRAPGYIIAGWQEEPHNLWVDQVAQDAFVALWETFAERYRGVPAPALSFDLVNEPPTVGWPGFTRDGHESVIRRAVSAIRAVDPARAIVIDGLNAGNLTMPELADLGVVHSARGYQPMAISHHQAPWVPGQPGPDPSYPGRHEQRWWDLDALREHYQPWQVLAERGVNVHIGEFGCYDRTPDDVAQRWLTDLLTIFAEQRWGYALWDFTGPFGLIGHRRPGAVFEELDGWQVDRRLLDLLQAHRISG